MGGSTHDKRKFVRVRLPRRAWCETSRGSQFLRVEDACEQGLFLRTPCPGEPGERVLVRFAAQERHVLVEARVVWARRSRWEPGERVGMGVRIERIEEGGDLFAAWLRDGRASGSSPGWLRAPEPRGEAGSGD